MAQGIDEVTARVKTPLTTKTRRARTKAKAPVLVLARTTQQLHVAAVGWGVANEAAREQNLKGWRKCYYWLKY
jgi:hypothetical protein